MRYSHHTHAVLQMTLSFAAETVTVPVLQSREINYHNTQKTQQNHTLKANRSQKVSKRCSTGKIKGAEGKEWE